MKNICKQCSNLVCIADKYSCTADVKNPFRCPLRKIILDDDIKTFMEVLNNNLKEAK